MSGEEYALTVARNDRRVVEASWEMGDDERDALILAVIRAVRPTILESVAKQITKELYDSRMIVGEAPMPPGSWHAGNDFGRHHGLQAAAELVHKAAKEQGE